MINDLTNHRGGFEWKHEKDMTNIGENTYSNKID